MNWLLIRNSVDYKPFLAFALILALAFGAKSQSITSISPTSGGIGTTLTITGTGFNPSAPNTIFFGPVKVTANANATGTSIVVNVPAGASSVTPVIVRNNSTGLQASSLKSVTPYFTITHSPALNITTSDFNLATYNIFGSSSVITTGDFDNDGYADIATGLGGSLVKIFKNNGLGGFTAPFPLLSLTGSSGASGLKTGDWNGDGNLDLAVSKTGVGDLDLFQGNGDGTFTTLTSIAGITGGGAGIALEDINNDGYIDLITSAYNNLYILTGDGSGTFTPATGSPKSLSPILNSANLSLADINNDGFIDVVVPGGTGNSSVGVLLNNQDNTFANPLLYATGSDPFRAVVGDYDGDGNMDIAVLSYNSGNITTLKGDGTGGFTAFASSPIAMPGINLGLEQGDFDGDGILDLVVGGNTTNLVPLLKGDGAGGFSSFPTFPYNVGTQQPYGILGADFNNDGVSDIAYATGSQFSVLLSPPSFRTTWVTTDGQITIPTTGAGYNYDVIWTNLTNTGVGNGAAAGLNGNYTISGLSNGDTYRVVIRGDFPRIFFNNGSERTKIRSVAEWGDNPWTSFSNAFYGCSSFNFTATDTPNLSGVTDLSGMLRNATTFTAPANFETWSVGSVTNMSRTFEGTLLLNRNMSSWDVSNVTDMTSMFDNSGYPTSFYEATLVAWDGLALQNGVTLGAAGIIYCSSAAIAARADLISSFGWTINDGGVCEPTTQTSNISFSNLGTTQVDISWSNGNGSDRIIVAKAGSAVDANPTDLTSYTASSTFGSGTQIGTGNFVIYNGSGTTTMTLTGLSPGISYHFRAYEYNGSIGNENYVTSTAVGNPYNLTTLAPEINVYIGMIIPEHLLRMPS